MQRQQRLVAGWLLTSTVLVLAMVAVGGITRLTRSGLSIVEWHPVKGALLPSGEAGWNEAFEAYRASPEGRLVNPNLDLEGFKSIFLVEWFHRLLGRFVGLFFIVPWLVFAWRRWFTKGQALRYLGWFAAGGAQGALGWFMVKSGLVDAPHVSPYRLTAHLSMALAVMSGLLVETLLVAWPRAALPAAKAPRWLTVAFLVSLAVTLAWGGFMAGHKAGWLSDTWPLMHGAFFPSGAWGEAGLVGLLSNPFLVHFTHRTLGVLLATFAVALFVTTRRGERPERLAGALVFGLAVLQATLGIATVLLHVPLWLAVVHQVNGALLLAATVGLLYAQPRPSP
jgi:cytochrome c oxidase assembly protein subunit 15